MPLFVNVGGVWRESTSGTGPSVNVGGAWRGLSDGFVNVSGIWRPFWKRNIIFNYTFGTSQNRDLYQIAISSGLWDGIQPIIATYTVPVGVTIGSASTASYALTTGAGFPAGSSLTLVNQGNIVGMGGTGGNGAGDPTNDVPTHGTAGGPAFNIATTINIYNYGIVGGGGGGGGGGASETDYDSQNGQDPNGGGGGGGAGYNGGAGGYTYDCYAVGGNSPGGTLGSAGTTTAGGAGGAGCYEASYYSGGQGGTMYGGTGGTGGGLGTAGANGNQAIFYQNSWAEYDSESGILIANHPPQTIYLGAIGYGAAGGSCTVTTGGVGLWHVPGSRYGTLG